jgi:hypothetical protein
LIKKKAKISFGKIDFYHEISFLGEIDKKNQTKSRNLTWGRVLISVTFEKLDINFF